MSNLKNRLSKLKKQATNQVETLEEVSTSFLDQQMKFPLVFKPNRSGLNLEYWAKENITQFRKDLLQYGGLLFRGFGIDTVEKFQSLMAAFPSESLEYKFRSSPRYSLASNVYVSTTYPNDQSIVMHSESSYAPSHPSQIVFCCIIPAAVQGETPIADNRRILKHLSPELKSKFMEKGVRYKRNLNQLMGLSWREVFQLSERAAVEEECRKNGMDFQWKNEDDLSLEWTKKAIWQHPVSGEEVWFNHALFFNKYMQGKEMLDLIRKEEDLPNNTCFGDGTEISKEEIEEIKAAYEQSIVIFPWQKGDVLFLDNMLMSHGRNPFEGERKIIVSMS